MKKNILLVILLIMTTLVSCGENDYKTPDESANEMINNIVYCFKSKDKETLKTYFSTQMQNHSNLDYEIEIAFEFIDGEIVSVGKPDASCIGPMSDKAYGAIIRDITTDKGIVYKIDFNGKYRCDDDKSREGVEGIRLINMTDDSKLPKNASSDKKQACCRYIGNYYGQSD